MIFQYVLRYRKPVPCNNVRKWARLINCKYCRRIRNTYLGKIRISTVFLGLDHNWGLGKPLLFETMIFGLTEKDGEECAYTTRCRTHRQALKMHHNAVRFTRGYLDGMRYLAANKGK